MEARSFNQSFLENRRIEMKAALIFLEIRSKFLI